MGGCEGEESLNAELGARNAEQKGEVVPARDLKERTKAFAVCVVRLVEQLPRGGVSHVIGRQLLRAGTSVAANYWSARRARSRRDFVAKMGIVEEEADECLFWLGLLVEARLVTRERIADLHEEAEQLLAITVASIRTARRARLAVPRSVFRVPR